jgi:truncated hemoglobin YjbI
VVSVIVKPDFEEQAAMSENQQTVFEMIGGEATFRRLVDTFYSKVEAD